MPPLNFNQQIYQDSFDRAEFLRRLDVASNTQYLKISMIPFVCEAEPEEYLSQRLIGKRFIEKVRDCGEEIKLYKLTHNIDYKSDQRVVSGHFFIFKYEEFDGIFVAVTLENSHFFHRELRPLLNGVYPEFLFAFIRGNSLKQLIQEFSVRNNITKIKIKRASQKLRFQKERSMSAVTWPNMSLEEAFTFIQENNGWFKSLQFDSMRYDRVITEVAIDRRGRVRTDRQFLMVYDGFIKPTCRLMNENYRLFSNRSRRQIENLSTRPLSIDYSTDLFQDVAVNKTFIAAVNKLDKATVSVLHSNPYVHMSVTDYNDGSTFDIWILKSNQIIVVPQMKGTVAGIKRLVNHIFDSFAEGEINNYQVEPV